MGGNSLIQKARGDIAVPGNPLLSFPLSEMMSEKSRELVKKVDVMPAI